jgi:trypsin-like peptidase
MKKILGLVLLVILGGTFVTQASAQTPTEPVSPAVHILQATMARITFRNATMGGLCHGYVASVTGGLAYVVTAKHCVAGMSQTALIAGQMDPVLRITVHYANGTDGGPWQLLWSPDQDIVVITAGFTIKPTSYADLCATCPSYTDQYMVAVKTPVPVVSLLSAGGGPAVLSSGLLMGGQATESQVMMPASEGTSGSPVLDTQGRLIGIVSTAHLFPGTEASPAVHVVSGDAVNQFVQWALDHATLAPQAKRVATTTAPKR